MRTWQIWAILFHSDCSLLRVTGLFVLSRYFVAAISPRPVVYIQNSPVNSPFR